MQAAHNCMIVGPNPTGPTKKDKNMDRFWHHFDRQFTPRSVSLLFWLTLLYGVACTGCVDSIRVKKDVQLGTHPTWCFRADYTDEKEKKTYSWNCFESRGHCKGALDVSKKYGSLANVSSLSSCKNLSEI